MEKNKRVGQKRKKDFRSEDHFIKEATKILKKKNNQKKTNNILKVGIIILIVFIGILEIIFFFLLKDDTLDVYMGDKKLKYSSKEILRDVVITDVSKIIKNTLPSIVSITSNSLIDSFYTESGDKNYIQGAGSGIIIGKSKTELMILTNNHVIEGSDTLRVKFINNKSYDAKVKGISNEYDIAVLAIDLFLIDKNTLDNIKVANIGYSDNLEIGNGVVAIGNALGFGVSATTGIISALDKEVLVNNYSIKMIQTDASINAGNSGGALVNANGEVIGITSAKISSEATSFYSNVERVGFAIPMNEISNMVSNLMNDRSDNTNIDLGIEGYFINDDDSKNNNMPVGFYISKIENNSIAFNNGLEVGNIIVDVDNKNINSFDDLNKILASKSINDQIMFKIKYMSNNEYQDKEIKLILKK